MLISKAAIFAALISLVAAPAGSGLTEHNEPTMTVENPGVEQANGSTVFSSEESELTVLPSEEKQPSPDELALLAPTFGCDLRVDYVHPSSHVSGNINGVAKIQCTRAAGKLTLHYSLIRTSPNAKQWGAPTVTNTGKAYLQNNKAVSCKEGPGNFRGWAQGVLVAPPGYVLEGPATHSKYGTIKGIACGASLLASSDEESPSEVTHVNFIRADLAD